MFRISLPSVCPACHQRIPQAATRCPWCAEDVPRKRFSGMGPRQPGQQNKAENFPVADQRSILIAH
jgi:predicted amidophosphoribosyltransferase